MDILSRLQFFDTLDVIAVAVTAFAWIVVGYLIENGIGKTVSVSVLMADYRRDWLRQFVTRSPRIFDANVIASLRQGTTFFASTCLIAIGGGLAVIGNTQRLLGVARDLSLESAPALVWEVKILLVILFMTNGLLKFVWTHRLFGYASIVMASVPNDISQMAYDRAAQAAEINITAARSYNRGLRSMYFALGSLAWLLGPIAFLAAIALTVAVLWRREFASHSRQILLSGQGDLT